MSSFKQLLKQVEAVLHLPHPNVKIPLTKVCEILQNEVGYYDWVGFYFSDFKTKILHLKAFSGIPTEHTSIPFGKGICGQVAVSNANFIVPDVHAQNNYISCSIDVKSELVIPIFVNDNNIGQIDIDSNTLNAFSPEDEIFIENVCQLIAKNLQLE